MEFYCFGKFGAFALTFGISIVILGLVSNEIPPENKMIVVISISEKKICVPVDENLRYQSLLSKQQFFMTENNTKFQIEEKNNVVEPKQKLNTPQKSVSEYHILLHEEKCYEFDGRK